ncbi:small integral membrane protein 5 isoform X2 [Macrotis lagotis]|uniref:small integral membrane protein 5 isoform X2 n=1 Tax=Macrotis lagotis TaxID=92651 RepID=UPI003D68A06E
MLLSPQKHISTDQREAWCSMATQNFLQEMHSMGQKFILKLQQLPQAEPVEIIAFSVILLFIGTVLLLLMIACSCCCTQCCCPEQRSRKIQVQPMTVS